MSECCMRKDGRLALINDDGETDIHEVDKMEKINNLQFGSKNEAINILKRKGYELYMKTR